MIFEFLILMKLHTYLVKWREVEHLRLMAWGAIGAAVYGVVRSMKKGTMQKLVRHLPNNLNLQQMKQPMKNMMQQVPMMTKNPMSKTLTKQQGL